MKKFTTAATEAVVDEERDEKIAALVAAGKTREEAEKAVAEEGVVEFEVDGRKLKAYKPTPGQLTFMMAAMGRGQTRDSRFGAIVNILMESLDEDGQDYLESRLISRKPSMMLKLDKLEEIFEYLVEEWFADPTQESSDSAL